MTIDGKDTERAQARVRFIVAGCATLYVVASFVMGWIDRGQLIPILVYNLLFLLVSVLLLGWIVRRPGISAPRRLLAIVHDNAGIGFAMAVGGESMLPLYGPMLWVTVGYGMRYGSRYLTIATAIASLTLVLVAWWMPYLAGNPFVLSMLLVTTVIVPSYAHVLLRRTREASERAVAANEAKSRFLAQASHDLRQPIHSITLFTACLRDTALQTEQQRLVGSIEKSLHSVSQLFRSILDLYTLDHGRVAPHRQPVSLRRSIEDVVRQNAEAARWAGVELRWHCADRWTETDPSLLGTLLQNLVSNAIKYSPGRRVLIGCRRRPGGFAIEVCDQGKGIAVEHHARVFDEFYRVRELRDRDVEGVGLGLSIVRRISVMLGLQVTLHSLPGRGTRLVVEGLQAIPAPAPAAAPARTMDPSPLKGLRVLLIEDDLNVLQATASLLQRWGIDVSTATSIPTGNEPCDLVITDFDLGTEASGADCIAYLRQLAGEAVPAVIMTGHEIGSVRQAVADPEIPVLSKPVRPAELRSLLVSLRLRGSPEPA